MQQRDALTEKAMSLRDGVTWTLVISSHVSQRLRNSTELTQGIYSHAVELYGHGDCNSFREDSHDRYICGLCTPLTVGQWLVVMMSSGNCSTHSKIQYLANLVSSASRKRKIQRVFNLYPHFKNIHKQPQCLDSWLPRLAASTMLCSSSHSVRSPS